MLLLIITYFAQGTCAYSIVNHLGHFKIMWHITLRVILLGVFLFFYPCIFTLFIQSSFSQATKITMLLTFLELAMNYQPMNGLPWKKLMSTCWSSSYIVRQ